MTLPYERRVERILTTFRNEDDDDDSHIPHQTFKGPQVDEACYLATPAKNQSRRSFQSPASPDQHLQVFIRIDGHHDHASDTSDTRGHDGMDRLMPCQCQVQHRSRSLRCCPNQLHQLWQARPGVPSLGTTHQCATPHFAMSPRFTGNGCWEQSPPDRRRFIQLTSKKSLRNKGLAKASFNQT